MTLTDLSLFRLFGKGVLLSLWYSFPSMILKSSKLNAFGVLPVFSDSFWYNPSTHSLRTKVLVPPNDVSCEHPGSQVDAPNDPPRVRGIVFAHFVRLQIRIVMFSKWINVNFCHFNNALKKKMTTYNMYSQPMPSDPKFYHLDMVQGKWQELVRLKEKYGKKHEKYSKALDRLTWLNACSSGLSVASGISSVTTSSTLVCLPVSIPLSAVSLAGASISCVAMVLTKKYQRNSRKSRNWLTL